MKFQMYVNLTKVTNNKNKVLNKIRAIVENIFDVRQSENDICGPTLLIDSNAIYEDGTLGLTLAFYFSSFSKEYTNAIKNCFDFLDSMTTDRKSFSFNIEKNLDIKNSKVLNNERFRTSISSVNIHYDLTNDKAHTDTFNIDELINYIDEV